MTQRDVMLVVGSFLLLFGAGQLGGFFGFLAAMGLSALFVWTEGRK